MILTNSGGFSLPVQPLDFYLVKLPCYPVRPYSTKRSQGRKRLYNADIKSAHSYGHYPILQFRPRTENQLRKRCLFAR